MTGGSGCARRRCVERMKNEGKVCGNYENGAKGLNVNGILVLHRRG